MAYDDIKKSPLSDLIENSQRIKISSDLNYELLKGHSEEKSSYIFLYISQDSIFINKKIIGSKLPTLIKLLIWS